MLYVFHVDTGRMMRFDMNLALESVSSLKEHIERATKIPADKQVLLISGGECLDSGKTVCSYSAGTDTNPIFLFSKSIIESPTPPAPTVDYAFDRSLPELESKMREHINMPNTIATLARRAQFAQHLHDLAREEETMCHELVHDQHVQQQGWAAVIANLEDITSEFSKRSHIFERSFSEYCEQRERYVNFLSHFKKDLEILQKIPVLSVLLEIEKQSANTSKTSEDISNISHSPEEREIPKKVTLYEWILNFDNKTAMDSLFENCSLGLERFDENEFKKMKHDIGSMLEASSNSEMKAVKGLENRLSGLETLMVESKGFVQQQANLAHTFANHQKNTKDPAVLGELYEAHKLQLKIMVQNLQQLWDIRRRCTKAKEELSINLYHRLRWVMFIEDCILEVDHKLVIYHENLKRLRGNLQILQQIHVAPATYLYAVVEVVRRRNFSQSFLLWASELACHLLTIHNEEVTRRKEFHSQFEGHFLTSLFPGMEDLPPAFATQAPPVFDSNLPKITEEDIDRLKKELPDLADNLNIPESTEITNFFLMKSLIKKENEKPEDLKHVQENIVQAVDQLELENNENLTKVIGNEACAPTLGLIQIKDLDRGCESETDTEEFEKVGQSPLELHFDKNAIPSPRARTQDVATSTEDNLQVSKSEHEKLKSSVTRLNNLTQETIVGIRSELGGMRNVVNFFRKNLSSECEGAYNSFVSAVKEEMFRKTKLFEQEMHEHVASISVLKKDVELKEIEIGTLSQQNSSLESDVSQLNNSVKELEDSLKEMQIKINQSSQEIEQLQKQLIEKEVEKEKAVKEARDRLNREHKAEIENIRSRFKLMTMEKSPSETNLEKSSDFSSLPSHTTLLLQMTENFELDKERAVNEALANEREQWERTLNQRLNELEIKFAFEKEDIIQNISRKVSEEKDKQIDILMEREKNLNLECLKYKSTIQQLAETNSESIDSALLDKINLLQKEKELLEEEIDRLRTEKALDMTTSVAVCEGKIDVMTSPIKQKELMSKSEIGIGAVKSSKFSIESCKSGDWVIVVWDPVHESFRVAQENKHMFFLHSDSLECLSLEVIEGRPNKLFCSGEVTDKEYCHARKSENRYKVPKGTKFFRVKVRPLASSSKEMSHSSDQSTKSTTTIMSQSQTTVSSASEILEMSGSRSLPSSPPRSHPIILEKDETDVMNTDPPEIFKPDSVEQHFAEDSGIVESIEQATVALDETMIIDSETNDR